MSTAVAGLGGALLEMHRPHEATDWRDQRRWLRSQWGGHAGGTQSSDSLSGNSGSDRISGSTGRDRISGGSGSDRISARDGQRDRQPRR